MQNAVDKSKLPGRRGLPRQFDDPDLAGTNYPNGMNRNCACYRN